MVQGISAHVTHKTLAAVDLAIIGVYFAIIFAIGLYFARRERTSTDYFLAGRNIGWFAIGASLFVSNISTEHFIGLAGSGATTGLAVGNTNSGIGSSTLVLNSTGVSLAGGTITTGCDNFFDRNSADISGGALTNACGK